MTNRIHTLKTWPAPFQAILDGKKRHEIRVDDRGYAEGDVLHLVEWDPSVEAFAPMSASLRRTGDYTGRECNVRVTYLTPGGQWELPSNLCVMSIERIDGRHD
jgi:hypothetical protein